MTDNHALDQHGRRSPATSRDSVSRCSLPSGLRLCGIVMLPTVPSPGRLTQLTDLGSLQLVDLVADPGESGADHREQTTELSDPIART